MLFWPFYRDGTVRILARSSLLYYDHGVRPDRRQRYPRVAVHHFEVERFILRREICPPDRAPIRQDFDTQPRGRPRLVHVLYGLRGAAGMVGDEVHDPPLRMVVVRRLLMQRSLHPSGPGELQLWPGQEIADRV
jgi:hypothetical protein